MNSLSKLQSPKSSKPQRRLGRGGGSKKGKTSGRGHKGYKARTGSNSRLRYEGGQNPIIARIPKLRGFKPLIKAVFKPINIGDIENMSENGVLNKKILIKKGFLKKGEKIKVLGKGEIKSAIKIEADHFSQSAREKIEKTGGEMLLVVKEKIKKINK
uniref:Large ribosomal subunit protein uL15 n=1 Tax=candidate division CPR3 bacterium TaxID=2268181 RepID=A0A7C4M139_UNCC3